MKRRLAGLVAGILLQSTTASAEPAVDRAQIIQLALSRSPALEAARERAHAVLSSAAAEGRLPAPEAMVSVWQVPLARPYAVNDSGMVMVGVQQSFPAPGSLGAKREAREREAGVEDANVAVRARELTRDVDHAYTDWVESTLRHAVHTRHLEVTDRILRVARARHAAGASLADVTAADLDVARVHADVVTDGSRVEAARARLNAILARDPGTPLGAPALDPPTVPAWTREELVRRAIDARPELGAASAAVEVRRAELRAADREATWPSFSVAALYFAPVGPAPAHGYGVNGSMSLPWLWGPGEERRIARQKDLSVSRSQIESARSMVRAEAVTAEASVQSAAARLQILEERALPASKRALDVTVSGYESGEVTLAAVLGARRAVVEVEMDLVSARAALDHALADLDAAVGAPVPRRPLEKLGREGAPDVH